MEFYYCEKCGNLFAVVHNAGPVPVCCGQDMILLEAGVTDAAVEKHVPEVKREGNKIEVVVGSTVHPMTEDHYIQMIAAVQGEKVQIQKLSPSDEPKAAFEIADGPVEVYEFCNLHGLWKAEA